MQYFFYLWMILLSLMPFDSLLMLCQMASSLSFQRLKNIHCIDIHSHVYYKVLTPEFPSLIDSQTLFMSWLW